MDKRGWIDLHEQHLLDLLSIDDIRRVCEAHIADIPAFCADHGLAFAALAHTHLSIDEHWPVLLINALNFSSPPS